MEKSQSVFSQNYDNTRFPYKSNNHNGFRRVQLGAIFSIGAHFTRSNRKAIITMPTGSGKTALIMVSPFITMAKKVLIITPSRLVRNQIAEDFKTMETLKRIGAIDKLKGTIKIIEIDKIVKDQDVDNIKNYDVVISTPNCIKPTKDNPICISSETFDLIIFDEAHHIPAKSWQDISNHFNKSKQILFTATPFRRDKKEIDGKFLYTYTMQEAYKDGIYGEIEYIPVVKTKAADIDIDKKAEKIFNEDKKRGFKHNIMVRTASKERAKQLINLYNENTDLKLRKIDSSDSYTYIKQTIACLRSGELDGIVCVDMLLELVNESGKWSNGVMKL